jgi:PIN domain nuclease of toxin-antitoxin system
MLAAVADTHAVVWYVFDDNRLSAPARQLMEDAAARGDHIGVSAMTLAELVYLVEKGRVPEQALQRVLDATEAADSVLTVISFDRRVAQAMVSIPRAAIPELPDRIIAATALYLGVPLITRDLQIRSAGIPTIW